ncbi:MAG: NfeD family protein [Tepidisphaeraceae bacterium]
MTYAQLSLLFLAIGVVLLVLEAGLPTHGILGAAGVVSLVVAVGLCFAVNQYLGLGVMLAAVVAAPFVSMAFVKLWPRTPVGRRMILSPPGERQPVAVAVAVGQTGRTVSELRPTGLADFGAQRLEVRSEIGIIPSGQEVRVAAVVDGRPVVRAV